jgi:hypothetical protein
VEKVFNFIIDLLKLFKPNHNHWVVKTMLLTGLGMLSQPWWLPYVNLFFEKNFSAIQGIENTGWTLVVLASLIHFFQFKEESLSGSRSAIVSADDDHPENLSSTQIEAYIQLAQDMLPTKISNHLQDQEHSNDDETTMWGRGDEEEFKYWRSLINKANESYEKHCMLLSESDDTYIRELLLTVHGVRDCLIKKRAYAEQLPSWEILFEDTHGNKKFKDKREAYLKWDERADNAKNKYINGLREFKKRYLVDR